MLGNSPVKFCFVAAQVLINDSSRGQVAYGDGIITSRNTFQKYYEQEELKFTSIKFLVLKLFPLPSVSTLFSGRSGAQVFRQERFARATTPRVRSQIRRFEDHQELLAPHGFVTERGRLPVRRTAGRIQPDYGIWYLRRAKSSCRQPTPRVEGVAEKRRQTSLPGSEPVQSPSEAGRVSSCCPRRHPRFVWHLQAGC